MIFIMLASLVMFVALLNYKQGFLLYLLLQMIWFPDTQLFYIGSSSINLNFICALYFVGLYIIKKKKLSLHNKERFPYLKPMFCIAISLIMSSITSLAGFISEFAKASGLIIMDIIIVYLIWKVVNTKEDFAFLFKGLTVIILFACIYIFYEKITNNNFIMNYKLSCTANSLSTYKDFQMWDARGYRCYSIFEHTICDCIIFALYISLTLILLMKNRNIPFKYLALLASGLCVPAIFFTQQRSGLFFLLIASFAIVDLKKIKFWKLVLFAIIFAIFVFPFISGNISLLLSMFISKYANKVSGSSVSLRLSQLNAVFHIMLASPLTGLGENFRKYYVSAYSAQALDFESLWFEQMAKHGVIGVTAYIVMIYYAVCKIPKKYKSKPIFFISLSYWLTYTLTSTPYFRIYFLYTVIFYFIKQSTVYSAKKPM